MGDPVRNGRFESLARLVAEAARAAEHAAEIAGSAGVKQRLEEIRDARLRLARELSPHASVDLSDPPLSAGRVPSFEQRMQSLLTADVKIRALFAELGTEPTPVGLTIARHEAELARSIGWLEHGISGRVWEAWPSDGRFARDSLL